MGAVAFSLTACSHSKVDEGAAPVAETADQAAPANTNPVPGSDPASPLVEDPNLAAQAPMPSVTTEETSQAPVEVTQNAEAQPVSAEKSQGPATQYRVKKGDTLMRIAFEQYGDLYRWKDIYDSNRSVIKDPSNVPPGTILSLSSSSGGAVEKSGEKYKIKNGDTLGSISDDVYGTPLKWKKLYDYNRDLIKNPNRIYAGFYLYYQPDPGHRLTHGKKPKHTNRGHAEVDPAQPQDQAAPQVAPQPAQPEARKPASK